MKTFATKGAERLYGDILSTLPSENVAREFDRQVSAISGPVTVEELINLEVEVTNVYA